MILGIDPGSRKCGYGIVDVHSKLIGAGFIHIQNAPLQTQILEMVEGFNQILNAYPITEVAMEDIFYAHNPKSVLKLAQFRGALSLKILQSVGKFSEYTPLQVKRAISGHGKASKEQVAFMVGKILGLKNAIKPLDITDALAVALTHAQQRHAIAMPHQCSHALNR
ncbi:crossover junction endodeoxyribonuclease RuvC [Helicobacter felis]|uniref:Crossover junction endodeoxyribonuclease RuvC n=1 Tax=Helicobacter felis (strain ATCC 49179 / CCUG 28539 / NCTC 12436 / CS1) TaxID=936155 RepID=E7AAS2_HELFC|nr:crossover junction endodeoxyribonuclease RuvC [Helicobacter felis]CBY82743.1 crossover junction endodeoxyribonuclease (ruvC) [Helicobacter felis ATCC 49179]